MTRFVDLPVCIALSGQEYMPLDTPDGTGHYVTKRILVNSLLFGTASVLKSQVIAATRTEFLTISGADMNAFVATQVGDADATDGSYDAYWLHPFAPLGGKLYTMIMTYLVTIGQTVPQAVAHLASIWAAAPAKAVG